ncbi:tRNA (cytosine(38)-C(5))-methyltransferase-like isoform X3 [Physella acuta]|nr:tRNA (cytosine(38)-C(5))-methyltransferase-like isoform X3 [Physella acuta]XP_059150719.1 tRNA (cytosine(38)-C(5))-methyltransferase-like isoform X3 [Physella acuta]XP_059150720.1 tRNA (cytosine(38)-C(5))-methyltransferase-like isoform X3 [Physella acuta]XP_059150721.1 tRNA (cytosine(38)-C(5))-methyltransferase-like isoform X3 [Physella acuta]
MIESLSINTILMSPPCQPFTRVGKKGDCNDVRTKSFLHLLQILIQLKEKPLYILVENVKGFEVSQTRQKLVEFLVAGGYTFQEFLLTPLQFGIPNCRLRYYMIAKFKKPFCFVCQSQILTDIPASSTPEHTACSNRIRNLDNTSYDAMNTISDSQITVQGLPPKTSKRTEEDDILQPIEESAVHDVELPKFISPNLLKEAGRNMRYCEEEDNFITDTSHSLSDYTEEGSSDYFEEYLLSDKDLKLFVIMDIVYPALKKSICFTKRYGHYIEGAGSVLQMTSDVECVRAASRLKSQVVHNKTKDQMGEAELEILRRLQLRYFTPREVANLLCFPPTFDFPPGLTRIQKYRVLGNSLNVHVVAKLVQLMTREA